MENKFHGMIFIGKIVLVNGGRIAIAQVSLVIAQKVANERRQDKTQNDAKNDDVYNPQSVIH